MRLRFLCPSHRRLVECDAAQARAACALSRDKARALARAGCTEQAASAAGCALEAAELLLREHRCVERADLLRFTECALQLQRLLHDAGCAALDRGLLPGCITRLWATLAAGASPTAVMGCCEQLGSRSVGDAARPLATRRQTAPQVLH